MTESNNEGPIPGWYRDPARPTGLRWWDGRAWTQHTRDLPETQPAPTPTAAETAVATSALSEAEAEAASVADSTRSGAVNDAATVPAATSGLSLAEQLMQPSSAATASADEVQDAPLAEQSVGANGVAVPSPDTADAADVAAEAAQEAVSAPSDPELTPSTPSAAEVAPSAAEAAPSAADGAVSSTAAGTAWSAQPAEPATTAMPSATAAPSVTPLIPEGEDAFALMAAATGSIKVIDTPEPAVTEEPVPATAVKPRRRGPGLVIGLAIAAVVVAGAILFIVLDPLGLFAPGPGYSTQVEDALAASIEAESTLGVSEITCPDTLTPSTAAPFNCTVTFDDGSLLEVTATITDGGQTVQWSPAS